MSFERSIGIINIRFWVRTYTEVLFLCPTIKSIKITDALYAFHNFDRFAYDSASDQIGKSNLMLTFSCSENEYKRNLKLKVKRKHKASRGNTFSHFEISKVFT